MKVLCIGHASWDITVPVDEYPAENQKYRFNEKVSGGGGPASNAAYLLGKWGVDTTIAASVGSDDFGTKIKNEFKEVNVDTNYIETSYDKDTSLSFILINRKNGSRTAFNVATERATLKKLSYEFTPDIILTDGHDYGASQNAISKYPHAISVIDAGRNVPEVLELCKYAKYIVSSKSFAENITGMTIDYENPQSLVNLYMKFQDKYPNANIVVTLEEHGCLYISNNQIKIMPGLKVDVLDSTGAGDIFHGAFVYGLANSFDMDKTVTIANIAAGLSVTKMGSRVSMPSLSETLDYYTQKMTENTNQAQAGVDANVQPNTGVNENPGQVQQQSVEQVQVTQAPQNQEQVVNPQVNVMPQNNGVSTNNAGQNNIQ